MNKGVLVAPREIVDVVYRASRVAGADSGVASMLGRSACFAVGQLGSDLTHVVEAFDQSRPPSFGFAAIARAETNLASAGPSVEELADPMSVNDLAYAAFSACARGCSVTMVCGDGIEHAAHAWLSTGRGGLSIEQLRTERAAVDSGLTSRVTARHREALRHGLSIPEPIWTALVNHAVPYLVSEALIDAAEGEPAN